MNENVPTSTNDFTIEKNTKRFETGHVTYYSKMIVVIAI